MSFKPYPKYKESGVEWLGRVPEHWEVRRLRQIGPLLKGSGGTKEDIVEGGVPCVRYGDLYTTHSYFIRQARTFVTAERAADYFPIRVGDVLFAASGEDLAEIGRSAVNLIEAEAVCGGDTVVLRPDGRPVPAFLGYACDSWVAKAQKASMGRGTTVKHIYPDELKRLVIFVPSPDEQALIATFLDAETAKIDALIAEQQRLIDLLQEKRQAVISHAVTKGLNPNAPMRDSGIEWLGEVPEHWEVKSLRHFANVLRGKFTHRPRNDPAFYDGEHPFIQTGDITGASKYITEYSQTLNHRGVAVSKEFPKGTLVMAIAANIGDVAILDFPAYFPDSIVGLVPSSTSSLIFIYYLIQAMKSPMLQAATVSTQMNLNVDQICSLIAACPPTGEQVAIGEFLDAALERFSGLISEAERSVILLQERRSALISAAVTGQIDVRSFSTDGGSEAA